jgi:hypothetical protein
MALETLDIEGEFTNNQNTTSVRGQDELAAATGKVSELR